MAKKFSGLQKEVFGLYRTIIREAAKKDRTNSTTTNPDTKLVSLWSNLETTASYARHEFRLQSSKIPKNDFRTIEFKVRYGYKQVKLLQMPGVKVVSGT
jgi:hypothetical protein